MKIIRKNPKIDPKKFKIHLMKKRKSINFEFSVFFGLVSEKFREISVGNTVSN
jgi:hypothetical protein